MFIIHIQQRNYIISYISKFYLLNHIPLKYCNMSLKINYNKMHCHLCISGQAITQLKFFFVRYASAICRCAHHKKNFDCVITAPNDCRCYGNSVVFHILWWFSHSKETLSLLLVLYLCYRLSMYHGYTYDMIMYTAQQFQWWNFGQICTHERHPIVSPYGRAMGCLSWVIQRKTTAIYRERTVLHLHVRGM